MRKTTLLLTEHLCESLSLLVESYIISFTKYPSDLASAGHWEIIDQSRNAAIQNSKAIIRWILDEYPDRVNLDTLCWTCKNNLRNHRWIAQ